MVKNTNEILRSAQAARDEADDATWAATWWGLAAKQLKRRADAVEDCKIIITEAKGKFPIVKFTAFDGRQTIYGVQNFYLRNQWKAEKLRDNERSYWYNDAGSSWMQGAFDTEHFQRLIRVGGELYTSANAMQREYRGDCKPGSIRYFSKAEKDLVAEFVLPTVRHLDEVCSREGKSGEEYGIKVTKKCPREKEVRVERALKLRMFKALNLLSADAV